MAFGSVTTIVPSAAYTATASSAAFSTSRDVGEFVSVFVNCTAASGTSPSMTLSVQWSHDGVNFADADGTADTLAAITAAKTTVKQFTVKAPFYRVTYAITGTTPSFTFSATSYVSD